MIGVNIFLADGFEDIEALATNDVLCRGGVETTLLSISDNPFVMSSHGIAVGADFFLKDIETDHYGTSSKDVMIFPGGMPGSKNLAESKELISLAQAHYDAGGSLAAICAAPGLVLSQIEGVEGCEFTCFDGFQDALISCGAVFRPRAAVRSGRFITGRSAGHALSFGLEILKQIKGEEVAAQVAQQMYLETIA